MQEDIRAPQPPNSRAFRLAIAACDHLVFLQRLDAAATILENYLHAHPPAACVLRRLGHVRLRQGRPHDAARLLEAALSQRRSTRPGADSRAGND